MKPQRRILVVDDSAEDRAAFRRFLRQDADYVNLIEEAITGEEAVTVCQRASFDVVLLDHHMPRMQGAEALRILRTLPGWSTPIIALTSTGQADVASLMLEAGANDFLFKDDITASSLSRSITNAITKERLQRKVEKAARRTARLQLVTAELSRARVPGQVIDVFLREGLEALGASAGFVALLSEDGTQLEMDASPGFLPHEVQTWRRLPLSAPLPVTDAARTGALVTLGTLEEKYARYPALKDAFPRFQALAAVPLRVGDNRLGALGVTFIEPQIFDEEEKDFLLVLSRQCALALERARLYEALQESETQRRLALEAARLGTWRWDIVPNRVHMDEICRSLFGLPPEGTLDSVQVSARILPEDRSQVQEFFRLFLRSHEPGDYQLEFRVLGPGDSVRWILDKGRVVSDANGNAERMVGVCYDITERKTFEMTLLRQKEAERKRADFEQQLVGIVSHDLKNPLAAILMQSALALRQGGLGDRVLKMMTRIQSSAERASRMIRDLLDFTQARLGGGIPLQVREFDAREVVAQVLEEVRQAFPHRQLIFGSQGDTTGAWDPDRLAQVVTNLMQNAVKYSPEDTRIQVRLRARGEEVELSVHNEGAPIPADKLPFLFEPMQRATSQADTAGRSVGLGLYIVRHIVEAHRGTISVNSTPDEGTLFTVRLPRHGRKATESTA